jgi:glycerol-3-phosphate dehydrogenase (NAD(P)+)
MGTDVVGCEIAGATKNVMAIAAGICDGLGFGENTRAVLITRGLAELGRLGVALGGKVLTFGGLAGVGDLVATCASPKSRNRTVGFELGQGRPLQEIVSGMQMVAEGVKSAGPLVGRPGPTASKCRSPSRSRPSSTDAVHHARRSWP